MTSKCILCFLIFVFAFELEAQEIMDEPARQVIVQKPVTVNVGDCLAMSTAPPVAPLKTRVVVVHNNMVPVPIECFQPPDSGTCSKDLARIYYDHETRTCKPFSYTGCGGNANRFQSIKNCYRICHPYRYKIRPKLAKNKPHMQDFKPNRLRVRYPNGGMGSGCASGGGMGGGGMGGGGMGPMPYPPMQQPYPGVRSPYGPPGYPSPYGQQQQSQMMGGGGAMQPLVEKTLINSMESGLTVQEKVIGEAYQPLPPQNSANLYG